MNAPTHPSDWLGMNQQLLAQALAVLRARLEGDVSAQPDPCALPTLARIAEAFGLSRFEAQILLLCASRELDAAAWTNDTVRHPTFGIALSLFDAAHWSALISYGPLRRWFLVELDATEGLTNGQLKIAEPVLHTIVGVDDAGEWLEAGLRPVAPAELDGDERLEAVAGPIARWWTRHATRAAMAPIELVGDDWAELETVAARVCARAGQRLFAVATSQLPQSPDSRSALARRFRRDLVLANACLMVAADAPFADIGGLADLIDRGPIVTTRVPLRGWSLRRPRTIAVPPVSGVDRAWHWTRAVEAASLPEGMLARAMGQFHLSPGAIASVGQRLREEAEENRDPDARGRALWRACKMESSAAISHLAETVVPASSWDDLVLPLAQMTLLRALTAQARHRDKVHEHWGFADKGGRGLGAATLFAGPSGTGKTLAAEVIAGSLDLALWRVDLSRMLSKWIGETEKNLASVFEAADPGGAVLLFDEADALFGKRGEVKDSHDRFANLEVSYLLQRMESYRGLAILTTNNEDALDKAFLRRLRAIVQFPFPDARLREDIWRRAFPARTPMRGLRFDKLARLQLSGGAIRNMAMTAAFLAAEADDAVSMRQLWEAAQIECAKIKHPLSLVEIEDWLTP